MRKKRLLYLLLTVFLLALAALLLIRWSNKHVVQEAKNSVYSDIEQLPANKVGLVLGTVRTLNNGTINLYFQYRIDAAAALYKAGKVTHLIVSGDNHVQGYDEPEDMRQALIAAGVPDSCITLDYAGFRTLDSIVRCAKVFGQTQFTIISQQFHNERAVFLARRYGYDAVAYNAKDVSKSFGFRTMQREYLARVKAVLDVYILNKQPKFLGEQVVIN